jgi:hypothetical protein
VLARERDSEKGGRATTSIQGRYDVCRVVDKGRGSEKLRESSQRRESQPGEVNEETQDSLSLWEGE